MNAASLRIAAALAAAVALTAAGLLVASGLDGEAGQSRPAGNDPVATEAPPPPRLSDTGLFSDPAAKTVAKDVLPFAPQYPLWSDGAAKRRYIYLPPGAAIDASAPLAWRFPVGTKLWKEFAFDGEAVETRYMVRLSDGRWLMAAYLWNADGKDATLAPARGVRGVKNIAPSVRHDVPGRLDCLACHGGRTTPVLGFNALDLSPDRDPLAPHAEPVPAGAVDLAGLLASGRLAHAPAAWAKAPPRIAAATPRARAALGYLHANCASCHRASGDLARLGLALDAPLEAGAVPAIDTAAGVPSRFRFPGSDAHASRIVPGDPDRSVLVRRMASRLPTQQMPPLGTHLVDREGLALVSAWIREDVGPAAAPSSPDAPSSQQESSR